MISIRYGMTDAQTRAALAHEIAHAERMDPPCKPDSRWESRAERRTAEILISRGEYAHAECLYGPHPALIAAELGVTSEVVETYRQAHPAHRQKHHVA